MSDIDINQTVESSEDGCITECFAETDRVGVEFTDAGVVKTLQ